MEFTPSLEQTMLRDSVRSHVVSRRTHSSAISLDRDALRREWSTFGEAGWLMAGVPEELGGLGGDPANLTVIASELAAGLFPNLFTGCAAATHALVASGAAARPDLADLLAGVMDGSALAALADVDDPAHPAGAAPTPAGYTLSGRKQMVLGGPLADHFLIAARIDGAEGLLLVPADAVARLDFSLIDGTPASELTLDGVEISKDALIASSGEALAVARDLGVVVAGAAAIGAAEAALWQTRDYLKTRKQFGVALATFQALQHRMADMYIALEQARSILFHGLDGLSRPAPDERRAAVSAARIVIARNTRFVAAQSIQLHGGIGTTEELPAGRYFQHVTVLNALFGGVDAHIRRFGGLMSPDLTITL